MLDRDKRGADALAEPTWTRKRLGDLTYHSTTRLGNGSTSEFPVYGVDRSKGLTPEPRYAANSLERYKVIQPGMFAYNPMRLNIGSIAYCAKDREPGLVSPDYVVFGCREEALDPDFMHYVTQGVDFRRWTRRVGFGSVRVRIYYEDLASLNLVVPTLSEQRSVADTLGSLDRVISSSKALIAALHNAKAHVMRDLVTGKERLANPRRRGWQQVSLGELVSILSGGTPSKGDTTNWNGSIPWISPKDMKSFRLSGSIDHISASALAGSRLKMVGPDHVLVVVRGMILVHSVPVAIPAAQCTFNQDIKALAPAADLDARFLGRTLEALSGKLLRLVTRSTHGTCRITTDALCALMIGVPPLDVQREIAAVGECFDERIDSERAYVRRVDETKQALLARLLGPRPPRGEQH